jgi:nucleoside phosphorylase
VVSAGFCGGLVQELAVGDVIWADEVIDSEGGIRQVTSRASGRAAVGGCSDPRLPASAKPQAAAKRMPLRLLSVSAPILTADDRRALHERFGAVAVDMESAAVAGRCEETGVPFTSVRAVSDGLDTPISAHLALAVAGERIRPGKLALAVLRRPSLIVELHRLARQSQTAAKALAEALTAFLASEVTSR